MSIVKHFRDDFDYNFWPEGFDPNEDVCCPTMGIALVQKAVDLLSNGSYFVDCKSGSQLILISYCPFCGKEITCVSKN